ncbi:hypothetical protein TNCV_3288491 [Trichonephila clavipes]|nr:hypothetical protein TNCV_3288491 [Trichonephila clavipes]
MGLTVCQTLPWFARSLSNRAFCDVMGRRLHLLGNVDDLARQLEQILTEIPQETIEVIYRPMLLAACIQARGASRPY